jgi:hypothetical protein
MMRALVARVMPTIRWRMLVSLVLLAVTVEVGCVCAPAAAVAAPTLHITPNGPYHNGQIIRVSVGPNRFFKPYSRINILECADPKGKQSNLPKSDFTCDGNTIQGNTVLVRKNGSFTARGYQIFSLPNEATLGELASGQPVCNPKHPCVLYVGENQGDFTWPKEFSNPLTISTSSVTHKGSGN